jgi:Mg-chelatase subunit ChlI
LLKWQFWCRRDRRWRIRDREWEEEEEKEGEEEMEGAKDEKKGQCAAKSAARKMVKKKKKNKELHAPGDNEFPGLLSLSSIQSAKTRTEDKSKTRRERNIRMRSRIEQILGREAT